MKNNLLYLFLFVLVLYSCESGKTGSARTPEQADELSALEKKASWLIGNWENVSEHGTLQESWKKESATLFAGESYFIKGTDTLFSESIRLEDSAGMLLYIPTVKDQNEGQPVPFRLTKAEAGRLVFENPAHDFPQQITYTQISEDSVVAEVSGIAGGKMRKQEFSYRRKDQ